MWQLLRRLAEATGDPGIAGVLHPHALRHFYVTTAVEAGAQLVHVQADVGHTSVDTTEQVYNSAARDPARSAVDLVADALEINDGALTTASISTSQPCGSAATPTTVRAGRGSGHSSRYSSFAFIDSSAASTAARPPETTVPSGRTGSDPDTNTRPAATTAGLYGCCGSVLTRRP